MGVLSVLGCQYPPDYPGFRMMAELGWVEGRNFVIDCVSPVGRADELQALARELVSRRPDLLIASPSNYIRVLKQETTTIPIIMFGTPDPVRFGFVSNLARPEGNITGVAWFGSDILPKRIEILREIVPALERLAIIGGAYSDLKFTEYIEENLTIAASKFGFAWRTFEAASASDYDEIFARIAAEHFDAAYIIPHILSFKPDNKARIIQLALRHLIPTVCEDPALAKGGLLLSYSQDSLRTLARVTEYIDRLWRGAKPSELPVEQATHFQLVINLNTAKTLRVTVPSSLIARADEVIE